LGRRADVTETGWEGLKKRRESLAGEYEKVQITPLSTKISPDDFDNLVDEINVHPQLLPLESDNAGFGLRKLYEGKVPQPNEIEKLRIVFGDEFADALIKKASKPKTVTGKALVGYDAIQDFQRAILTSYDFSAPGRQGKNFILYPEWWRAFPTMFKSWKSKDFFDASMATIEKHPNFKRPTDAAGKVVGKSLAERAGLDLTGIGKGLNKREEIFRSTFAEKWIPGVEMSERAYMGYLNKLRSDMFNRYVKESVTEYGEELLKDDVRLKAIGDFINNATGRGKLPGESAKISRTMNRLFFAPKLHAGKIRLWKQALNPYTYSKTNKVMRKAMLRSLFASTGLGLLTGELFRQMGAEVSNDPTNTDFRKIKIGNTRIDPFGGDQQYATLVARYFMGKTTSSTSGNVTALAGLRSHIGIPPIGDYDDEPGGFGMATEFSVLADFAKNRLAPVAAMMVNLMNNESYGNEDFGIKSEVFDKTIPIAIQDVWELAQEDPKLIPFAVPAAFGVGINTYGR